MNRKLLLASAVAAALALPLVSSAVAHAPEVREREVLRDREGRQERLPDEDVVLRGHLEARQPEGCLDLRAEGRVREGRGQQPGAEGVGDTA